MLIKFYISYTSLILYKKALLCVYKSNSYKEFIAINKLQQNDLDNNMLVHKIVAYIVPCIPR